MPRIWNYPKKIEWQKIKNIRIIEVLNVFFFLEWRIIYESERKLLSEFCFVWTRYCLSDIFCRNPQILFCLTTKLS